MKLQQLKYIWEVTQHNLNISKTAQGLYVSQPSISKQIRLLEEELRIKIFFRNGKHLTNLTPIGKKIVQKAGEVLELVDKMKKISQNYCDPHIDTLLIASTYVNLRYQLPAIISFFVQKYPKIMVNLSQGTPDQVANMVLANHVDFAILTEKPSIIDAELLMLPCYRWQYTIWVSINHPLSKFKKVTIAELEKYPLIICLQKENDDLIAEIFSKSDYKPKIIFTSANSDIIKNCIRMYNGVGIMAKMAYDSQNDNDLICLDDEHIFASQMAVICIKSGNILREFELFFIKLCAQYLSKEQLVELINCKNQAQIDKKIKKFYIPEY